jgi:hypothetical protein
MTVYVADAHAHGQRLASVVKMATLLEEYISVICKSIARQRPQYTLPTLEQRGYATHF